jgi:outer membrane protein assembly factor BamD (BamD/ComL family)
MYKGARAMYKKGEHQDAAKTVEEYIRLMTEAYGVDHPRVVQATDNLEQLKQISGESARSKEGEDLEKTAYKADQARSSKATSLG